MSGLYGLTRPLLFALDAEKAHGATIQLLKAARYWPAGSDDPRLAVDAFGLHFANPLGMGAGFDKHAEIPDSLLRIGFGFTEIGTVTPLPQSGNPQPRLFRPRQSRWHLWSTACNLGVCRALEGQGTVMSAEH